MLMSMKVELRQNNDSNIYEKKGIKGMEVN